MEIPNNIKLNKKDEKKINTTLHFFKGGLITGSVIIIVFLFIILALEILK